MTYFPLIASIIFFGFVHSLTASNRIKNLIAGRYYRLIYNGLAIVTFGLIAWVYTQTSVELLSENHWLKYLGYTLIALGTLDVLVVLRGYDLQDFSGFDALTNNPLPPALKTDGLLKYVRHPLYFALIVVFSGLFLTEISYRNLIGGLAFIAYILIGIHFEERKLVQVFGDAYRTYQKQIPMLIPKFW